MNKTLVFVTIFCVSFTSWWAWRLDSGPFIYRHSVPDKLESQVAKDFLPYLRGREIESIRFGQKNAHQSEKVPVEVNAHEEESWLINNTNTGPVLIKAGQENDAISIYWDVPEDMPLDQSYSLLADTVWNILIQYDQIRNVQHTYE